MAQIIALPDIMEWRKLTSPSDNIILNTMRKLRQQSWPHNNLYLYRLKSTKRKNKSINQMLKKVKKIRLRFQCVWCMGMLVLLHGPIPLIGTSTYLDLFSDAPICLCTVRPKPHIRIHLSDEKFKFLRILSFSAKPEEWWNNTGISVHFLGFKNLQLTGNK